MRDRGRAALSGTVEDAGAERPHGSCAGAAKGGEGDARGHIPSPRLSFPALSPLPHASTPPLRNCVPGDWVGPGAQGSHFIVSPRPRLRVRTAFPVSRETMLHVGPTSERSDVTAHAVRQRRAGLPCHAPGPTRRAEAGKLTMGVWKGGLVL